ncbi:MAG: class II aldolase/adducin family protein [Vicinamibacteria bacterium]|nr:class II aldolase/adducin family protein [Vicinamibacteria bacterium]
MDPRAALVEYGRRLYDRGLIGGSEGNLSIRIAADRLLVTPGGVSKGFLAADMLVETDLFGRALRAGPWRVSSEVRMHAVVYARRADVGAIVHAHPPVATAFAAARMPLEVAVLPEAVVALGPIPIVAYATPGTEELAARVGDAAADAQTLLLENHGALTLGDGLERAWQRMEMLEQFAKVSLHARTLGGARRLPDDEVERLAELRARGAYGPPLKKPGGASYE